MRRLAKIFGLLVLAAGGLYLGDLLRRQPERPEPAMLVERIREVARLQALEVRVSKTVDYTPDPKPSPSLAGELWNWAVWSANPKEGRAIVSGVARLGIDLGRLDESAVSVADDVVTLVLPPVVTQVELDLDRTEIVRSNLDSGQTAELFEKGRRALAAEIAWNPQLEQQARRSVQSALERLLLGLGFREVRFVEAIAAAPAS